MATVNSSSAILELREAAKLQPGAESVPNQLGKEIIPVININPKHCRVVDLVRSNFANNATSATIYTTPTDADFFLVASILSLVKDVTATSIASAINVTIDGASRSVNYIRGITLQAQDQHVSISYPFPIKVDRNTNITVTNSAANANISATGIILGYVARE